MLGDQNYYGRFGFDTMLAEGIEVAWAGPYFAGLTLIHVAPPRGKARNSLRLSDLGFSEGERRFQRSTRWDIPLPFGAMGPAMRPDWVQLQVYAPDASGSGRPTVLSAYYNDRLVYSGTLAGSNNAQSVDFALPRHLLRARNQLSLVAQRDPGPESCGTLGAAHPISITPALRVWMLSPDSGTSTSTVVWAVRATSSSASFWSNLRDQSSPKNEKIPSSRRMTSMVSKIGLNHLS